MRYSQLFGKTVRKAPRDAVLISHKLLYRGGFIRDLVAGRYSFLPLGYQVFKKVAKIIDEEMEAIDSQRVITPTLHPLELWQATHRDEAFGDGLMRVRDRRGADFAIGATAEAVMVDLVNKFKPSYKDLPIVIHQFSQKFRDELRARGGLVRLREFMMKDAYSFCAAEKSSFEIYQKMYDAYLEIAERLGIPVIPVEAFSGAIGGKHCHEFIYLTDKGEDRVFVCSKCNYAANVERAEFVRKDINSKDKVLPCKDVHQPKEINTIPQMAKFFKLPESRMLKDVMYRGSDGKYYVIIIRGDLDVSESKLLNELGIDSLEPATEADLGKLGTKRGSVPVSGLKGVTFLGDLSLKTVKNFVGGYKREKEELEWENVNLDRDFKVFKLIDAAEAYDGAKCARCSSDKLVEKRGIEFGHVFKFDHFYSAPMGGNFVDKEGKDRPFWMGSYGIGVERAIACIVEAHHDSKGIIWPEAVAPYQAHLVSLDAASKVVKEAEKVYQKLVEAGIEVLYDDRDESAGVKLMDADLIGIPKRVIVSKRSLKKGGIEVSERDSEKIEVVSVEKLLLSLRASRTNEVSREAWQSK